MTKPLPDDVRKTNELILAIDSGQSWLRHSDLAGQLDWLLLHGATAQELQEVRPRWKEHIAHLRQGHQLEITQSPQGFYKFSLSQSPNELGKVGHSSHADLDEIMAMDTSDEDDLPPDESSLEVSHHAGARITSTARALMALHQAGELKNPVHREAVGMFIRKVSECSHWHNSADYRSRKATKMIQAEGIRSVAQYQDFCKRNLRHEHMVPNSVIYRMILEQDNVSEDWLVNLFIRYSKRATITREEDRLLMTSRMPEEFYVSGHPWHQNHLARYLAAGLESELEERTGPDWLTSL